MALAESSSSRRCLARPMASCCSRSIRFCISRHIRLDPNQLSPQKSAVPDTQNGKRSRRCEQSSLAGSVCCPPPTESTPRHLQLARRSSVCGTTHLPNPIAAAFAAGRREQRPPALDGDAERTKYFADEHSDDISSSLHRRIRRRNADVTPDDAVPSRRVVVANAISDRINDIASSARRRLPSRVSPDGLVGGMSAMPSAAPIPAS